MLTKDVYLDELRQIACDYAEDHPEVLDDFQHFKERFLDVFYMADGREHVQAAFEGWLIAKSRSRNRKW